MPPLVELLSVPKDTSRLNAYLLNNFRRVADAVERSASAVGDDDIEITSSTAGLILTSPNGTRYRVTVDDAGTLVTTAL